MAEEQKKSSLTPTLIITTFLTCFGSSMLYGYNMAVLNLPSAHIKCFLSEAILNISCSKVANEAVGTTLATVIGSPAVSQDAGKPAAAPVDSNFLYALVSSVFVVAGAIGAFLTGWLADFFGRRNGLLFNHIFVIIGAILVGPSVWARSASLFFIGRFFIGFNCGVTIGLASIFLTEIAPREVRGAIGACHQLAVTMGIVVGYLLTFSWSLNSATLWPVACALTAIPALVSLCLLPFCPESPRFLYLKKNRVEDARKAFLSVNTTEDVDLFLSELCEEVEFTKSQPQFRFMQLFTQRDLRMPLIIACLIQVMQQLSGINAVVAYSNLILENAGVEKNYLEYCVLAIGILNVVVTIVSLPMLERFGRRTLLLWPSVILAISLALLTIAVNVASGKGGSDGMRQGMGIFSTVLILIYMTGFALGLGPVPALIVAEIFRQGPRGAAYSISQFIQWASNLLVLITFPSMSGSIGGYSFLPFLAVVTLCWVFFFFFMPETRGRTFDDVARDLAFGNVVIFKRSATFQPEAEMVEKQPMMGATGGQTKDDNRAPVEVC